VPQPPPLQLKPKLVRPLPPARDLLGAAVERVVGWAGGRARDEAGLDKLLHQASVVCVCVHVCMWAELHSCLHARVRLGPVSKRRRRPLLLAVVRCCLQQAQDKVWADVSAEMSEVAVAVADAIWDDLLADTAQVLVVLAGDAGDTGSHGAGHHAGVDEHGAHVGASMSHEAAATCA
jgi:hypothetical protein